MKKINPHPPPSIVAVELIPVFKKICNKCVSLMQITINCIYNSLYSTSKFLF